jgi:hypothetical protein
MPIIDLNDRLFEFLNNKGYIPIRAPEGEMEPPTAYILDEEDSLQVLRSRKNLFSGKQNVPGLEVVDTAAVDLEEAMVGKVEGKASFSLFSWVLAKFGVGGEPEAHAGFGAGDGRQFTFKNVRVHRVDSGAVLDALEGYDPKKLGVEFLKANKVYIAYSFLYCSELEVKTDGNIQAGGGAKAEITGVGKGEIEVQGGIQNGQRLRAKEPVAFAMRLVRLKWADDKYELEFTMGGVKAHGFAGVPDGAYVPRMGMLFDIAEGENIEPK